MATTSRFTLTTKEKDSYFEWILAFPWASIRSDDHLRAAQEIMDRLPAKGRMDVGESLYLDALSDLVATYEDEHHAIAPASDADMLRHLLEAKGVSQADLHRKTGLPKSTISAALSGKKPFSRQMSRRVVKFIRSM